MAFEIVTLMVWVEEKKRGAEGGKQQQLPTFKTENNITKVLSLPIDLKNYLNISLWAYQCICLYSKKWVLRLGCGIS